MEKKNKITREEVSAECGNEVELMADGQIIKGVKGFNYTGRNTNLVIIEFIYNNRKYEMPFSRKTGKLYRIKLGFDVRLILN